MRLMIHCQQINTHVNIGSSHWDNGRISHRENSPGSHWDKGGPHWENWLGSHWENSSGSHRDMVGSHWDPDEFSQWAPLGPTLCPTGIPVGSHWDSRSNFHWGCSWSYYTAILIRQILRELWDFVDFFCTYATVDFVDATPLRPLNGFHSNFVGLLVTICSWSYYTAILIRQILRELWDFVDFFCTYATVDLCGRNSSETAQRISFKFCGIVSHHM